MHIKAMGTFFFCSLLSLGLFSCRIFYEMKSSRIIPLPIIKGAVRTGNKTCADCHKKPEINAVFTSGHRGIMDQSNKGCEACHGLGSLHVRGKGDKTRIFSPPGLSNNQSIRVCNECHHLPGWRKSAHAQNFLTCLSCHKIHGGTEKALLKTEEKKLCNECHSPENVNKEMPSHKLLVQRKSGDCSSCHKDVHSIKALFLLKANKEADCINCHRKQSK